MTVALVTGATGQDGSYLVERLLSEGVEVHGLVRSEDLGGALPEGLVVHTPVAYCCGFSNVAWSWIVAGSKTTTSAK